MGKVRRWYQRSMSVDIHCEGVVLVREVCLFGDERVMELVNATFLLNKKKSERGREGSGGGVRVATR